MSGVLETTPARTQAAILRSVLAEKHPRLALGAIASRYHLSMADLRVIIEHHGYPRSAAMQSAVIMLEQPSTVAPKPAQELPPPPDDDNSDEPPTEDLYVRVPIGQIQADPNNLREELEDIEDLAESIKEIGLIQPITARRVAGNRLVVVAGHRRLAAIRSLGHTHVDVIIKATIKPSDVIAAMLIENGQRRDLDPIEEARGLAALKAQGNYTDAELGKKIGRHQVFVSGRLALLALSPEDQLQVRAGTMRLVDATNRGRLNSGKVHKTGQDKNWHLSPTHELADRAKARCLRLEHPRGRTVGGMACGACWESVIRADEREHTQKISHELGKCVTCDAPVEKSA